MPHRKPKKPKSKSKRAAVPAGQHKQVRLVGKLAEFDATKWATAIQSLALQLERERREGKEWPKPDDTTPA